MENHESRIAHSPEAATDEPASSCTSIPDFEPVPLRYRSDGLTPERQCAFVEALADCGLMHVAAERVGVSPQAVNRTRRRADARGFDLACTAARRFGARRLHDTAWERAIEGSIRRHYYHGELKSEERVFDNRLLIYLLGRTEHLLDEPPEAAAVAANWEPWVEAMAQGTPLPDVRADWRKEQDERLAEEAAAEDEEEEEDAAAEADDMVWEDEETGVWWTSFPPPADFWGEEFGEPGDADYRRFLTDEEQEALEAQTEADERERAERIRRDCARRDLYFGFAGGLDTASLDERLAEAVEQAREDGFLFAKEAEPSETSTPRASNPELVSGSMPSSSNPEPPESSRRKPGPMPTGIVGKASSDTPSSEAIPASPGPDAQAPLAAEPPAAAELYEPSWFRQPGGPLFIGPVMPRHEATRRALDAAPEPPPEEESRPRIWNLG